MVRANDPESKVCIVAGILLSIIILTVGCTAKTDNYQTTIPSTPAPQSTPTLIATLPSTSSPTLGISREYVQRFFEDAGFTFDTFGDIDMVGGVLFDGTGSGIIVDIFGPAHDVEAVELSFSLGSIFDDGVHEAAIALSSTLLLLTIIPEWEEGPAWAITRIVQFGTQGDETIITTQGDRIVTLYYREKRNLGLLSIEGR